MPLHAEAAAVQANQEINTIGWGSLAAVLLLVWLAFRSLRPILLVAASLLIGCGVALAVTVLVFGKVHVLTLVLVRRWWAWPRITAFTGSPRARPNRPIVAGTAAASAARPVAGPADQCAGLPGIGPGPVPRPAPDGTVLGGGPGRSFLTVIFWFPWLDGGEIRQTRFSQWLGNTLERSRGCMAAAR